MTDVSSEQDYLALAIDSSTMPQLSSFIEPFMCCTGSI